MQLLDGATFSKVMPHHNLTTILMVAPRADAGDYGVASLKEDFWAFAEQSEFSAKSEHVRFAHIMTEWPAPENTVAFDTYQQVLQVDKDYYPKMTPRIYLFSPNSMVAEPYPRFNSINVIALSRWLSQKAHFYMSTSGTIYEYYVLARQFVTDAAEASDVTAARKQVLEAANEAVKTVLDFGGAPASAREMASYYIKTMERIMEKGDGYVMQEITRLEDLVSGADVKLSQEKRQALQKRVNVLTNFIVLDKDSKPMYYDPPKPSAGKVNEL